MLTVIMPLPPPLSPPSLSPWRNPSLHPSPALPDHRLRTSPSRLTNNDPAVLYKDCASQISQGKARGCMLVLLYNMVWRGLMMADFRSWKTDGGALDRVWDKRRGYYGRRRWLGPSRAVVGRRGWGPGQDWFTI